MNKYSDKSYSSIGGWLSLPRETLFVNSDASNSKVGGGPDWNFPCHKHIQIYNSVDLSLLLRYVASLKQLSN